jgi:exodeoxyribonuclease-3
MQWRSHFANARARNVGWRIDYIFTSQKLAKKITKAYILPEVMGSDHCPVVVEVNI